MLAVQEIDRALKRLYNIDSPFCAEQFLIFHYPETGKKQIATKELLGALYIHNKPSSIDKSEQHLDLGIYLNESIRIELDDFEKWKSPWDLEQIKAFSIASEEVSHFHYLIYNLERNRPVSEFELELQAEIDKFLLLYFSNFISNEDISEKFDSLFSQLFVQFRLATGLSEHQRQRYIDASTYAKRVFQRMRKYFINHQAKATVLAKTRSLYRMSVADKVSFVG